MNCLKRLTGLSLLAFLWVAGCTPHFNRKGKERTVTAGMGNPIPDLAVQGGGASPGMTAHFHVSRVAIGGNVRRIQATTPSGIGVQGGPGAPR
jgi:hypothetical protein